ncbi:MAG: NADH-quinone oxidoreductase subunit L [Gammaproteobacteria bacterium]
MSYSIIAITLLAILAPLLGATLAGVWGKYIGKEGASIVTIAGVSLAFIGSFYIFERIVLQGMPLVNHTFYTWGSSTGFNFGIGFLVDRLTAVMLFTVTFISLLVHIYSIGYMQDDPGYQRFFSYMSLFTFFMMVLVAANNFLLLFFGWEGVGLVSYLLIGFWYQKISAINGGLKAFIVNRIGDCGFILGIAAIFAYCGTLDYHSVFSQMGTLALMNQTVTLWPGMHCSLQTLVCILLFVGAMGKSAQIPLHIWLPESMEGPTPISALIHAATMVTAGIYMVARLSPIYELSQVALSLILVIGATGALFLGILAVIQTDIKRVIAYSTMSQLGYMMAANGASAFSAGIFHLLTHACFKALLFLAAGSVIMAMHHEQDMRKMGGLRKYLPITYVTFLMGALALAAIPPFSGFYSKDAIIDAVHLSHIPGAQYAYYCLLFGAFFTALYIFRAFFLTFHGQAHTSDDLEHHIHESQAVVTMPLILLALLSIMLGAMLAVPMLYSLHYPLLGESVYTSPLYNTLAQLTQEFPGVFLAAVESIFHAPFWFAFGGIVVAWVCYLKKPHWPAVLQAHFRGIYWVLMQKYGFDALTAGFVRGTYKLSRFFYQDGDEKLIDGVMVNGSGQLITRLAMWLRKLQSGYLYHYAFAMVLGLLVFCAWLFI